MIAFFQKENMQAKQTTYEAFTNREWLLTNGIGGYASSTLCGANTRRYHGLLVASYNPPTDRSVLVSSIQERIIAGDDNIEIATNAFPGTIAPEGYQYIESFERSPLPKVRFQHGAIKLNKTIFMVYGSNTTVVEYENTGSDEIDLDLIPLFVYRDYHSLFKASDQFDFYHEIKDQSLKIYPKYGTSPIFCGFTKGNFVAAPAWYHSFQYAKEEYRGLDAEEDAKRLGHIQLQLAPQEKAYLVFTTDEALLRADPADLKSKEVARLSAMYEELEDPFLRDLAKSGDQFLVHRKTADSNTIIAGYHWFTDWGRDTMIAMRGLTIALGKKEISESIIRTFLQYLDGGMIPNRFPDQGETPEYNTIDATLWLFVVLYEYYEQFKDLAFIKEVFPRLSEILDAHRSGTRYNIHVSPEGLLYGGEDLSQLTWMDAKVGDFVVTPRQGCPVEINALWFNALHIYTTFGELLGENIDLEKQQAKDFAKVFRKYFVNEMGYLNDVVIPETYIDSTIRPNQIYAISLPFSPITQKAAQAVLKVVESHLYTDLGLRSLSPEHEDFKPIYAGDQWHRDGAYHQGTVWAFLWGEYAMAYLKANKFSKKAIAAIQQKAARLQQHFYEEGCLMGIAEIFDGEQPEAGRGCIQQAWSIGMLIKVFQEINQKLA